MRANIQLARNEERDAFSTSNPPGLADLDVEPLLGEIALAQIIAEAAGRKGEGLERFPTVSKLWKWMGVAVMPDGKRQRLIAGLGPRENPYHPQRRAILAVIGDSLMCKDNAYREYYLEIRKKLPKKWPDVSDGHSHNHALRLMEKRLLRDLWQEWRRLHGVVKTVDGQ